jgi:hypothetical protein
MFSGHSARMSDPAPHLEGSMSKLVARLAGMVLAGATVSAAAPGTAEAQFFFQPPFHRPLGFYMMHRPHHYRPPVVEELSPREVMAAVQRQGFRDPSGFRYDDDVAVVTATARDGRRFRLEVDIYSGRIVDTFPVRPEPRPQVAQRAPDQGAAVRRAVPEQRNDVRVTPERPPTTIRREPLLPPQPQQAKPPPKAEPRPQPPTAQQQPPAGTRAAPRRIDITPPAALDDVRPPAPAAPSGPPINSVPPAALE